MPARHKVRCRRSAAGDEGASLVELLAALTVVSIVKILRWFASSRPMRQAEWCRCDFVWSMNECDRTIVWLLWWCRRLLYDARPIGTDL